MKLKTALVWLCLITVTCCVIFFPGLISRDSRSRLPGKKNAWNYSEKPKQHLTDVEFARLLSVNYFDTMLNSYHEIDAADFDRDAAKALLQSVMPNDTAILSELCTIMDTGDPIEFNANTVFCTRDGYPEALRLINAAYQKGDRFFSMYYEEKTMTLISINYTGAKNVTGKKNDPREKYDFANKFPTAALIQYYLERLMLPPDRVTVDYGDDYFCAAIEARDEAEKIEEIQN